MRETDRLRKLPTLNSMAEKINYAFSPYSYGNMAFPYGKRDEVIYNRQIFLSKVGMNLNDVVFMRPVHKVNIAIVDRNDKGKGAYEQESAISSTDGLITTEKGVGLALNAADCAPIIITNKKVEFLALVHAGREGTDAEICRITISRLKKMGFTGVEEFVVGIGPTIGGCYEQDFLQTRKPDLWLPFVSIPLEADVRIERVNSIEPPIYKIEPYAKGRERIKLSIDLVECNIAQLEAEGILRENIAALYICPACNAGKIFSHVVSARFSGTDKSYLYPEGRFMAVCQLNP